MLLHDRSDAYLCVTWSSNGYLRVEKASLTDLQDAIGSNPKLGTDRVRRRGRDASLYPRTANPM